MSGRKIYSAELKLEIVQRYLRGDISIKQLADEYHISSNACIQEWLALYREHGETGLCTTHARLKSRKTRWFTCTHSLLQTWIHHQSITNHR